MRLQRCGTALAAAALVGALAACGGSDAGTPSRTATSTAPTTSSTPAPTSTSAAAPTSGGTVSTAPTKPMTTPPPANDSTVASPTAALESAVRSYSGFYTGGNGPAAYALLSARCQKLYSPSVFNAVVKQVHQGYGTTPIATLRVVVNGDSGFATYTYPKSGLNQNRQPWVLEGGSWKNDGC